MSVSTTGSPLPATAPARSGTASRKSSPENATTGATKSREYNMARGMFLLGSFTSSAIDPALSKPTNAHPQVATAAAALESKKPSQPCEPFKKSDPEKMIKGECMRPVTSNHVPTPTDPINSAPTQRATIMLRTCLPCVLPQVERQRRPSAKTIGITLSPGSKPTNSDRKCAPPSATVVMVNTSVQIYVQPANHPYRALMSFLDH